MNILKKSTLVMLLIAAVLMAGCKKETETENAENTGTETVDPQNPNPAQDTALNENMFSEYESIYRLYPNYDGTLLALAQGEHTDFLLKLDNNGYVQQRVELGYRSRRVIVNTGEYIMLLGNMGSVSGAPYGMYKQGYVAVYDKNIQLVATMTLMENQYYIDVYSLIQDTYNPNVFYVGGLAADNSYQQYPYLCTIQFSEGILTPVSSKVYTNYQRYRVVGMVEKTDAGQKDLILETIHYSVIDDPYNSNSSEIHIVKLNYFEESTGWGSKTWDIVVTGPHEDSYTGNNSMVADENNVYCFGYCNDDKEHAPSNGGYWDSGFAAAVNWRQGQTVWTKTFALSNYSDQFATGLFADGCLYACGMHSGLGYSNTGKDFANGVVAKISLSGDLVTYKTFGDPKRYAAFLHAVKDSNGHWACAGWSGVNLDDGGIKYDGWFLKMDMSSGGASKIMSEDVKKDDMDPSNIIAPMDVEMRF